MEYAKGFVGAPGQGPDSDLPGLVVRGEGIPIGRKGDPQDIGFVLQEGGKRGLRVAGCLFVAVGAIGLARRPRCTCAEKNSRGRSPHAGSDRVRGHYVGTAVPSRLDRYDRAVPRVRPVGWLAEVLDAIIEADKSVGYELRRFGLNQMAGMSGRKSTRGDEVHRMDEFAHRVLRDACEAWRR